MYICIQTKRNRYMFKYPTPAEIAEINARNEAQAVVEIAAFNKPGKPVVAINTVHIGDDNDYSCFLGTAVYALWETGTEANKEIARRLFNTDSLINKKMDAVEFNAYMEQRKAWKADQDKYAAAYERNASN